MVGHKPVGINRYFAMLCIWDKLCEHNIDVSTQTLWTYLATMYNLDSLNEIEAIPFPNEVREFYLPELEFGAMKVKKEEKSEDKTSKSGPSKRNDSKESVKSFPVKDVKKEEKSMTKKETPRRDSKDGKDIKSSVNIKKEIKKDPVDKLKQLKGRSSVNVKEEEKSRTPSRTDEAIKRQNKRPTRGSTKPDDITTPTSRKSQSPLTVTPTSMHKRRRL
ncbi:MRG/MORF4L binding protein [Carabus blaptoides fortunei]